MQKIFTLLFSLCTISAYAQNYGGSVYDRERRPLQEATVYNQRTGAHTHTNEVGTFRLQDGQPGDTLKVSHVSFKTQVLVLQKQSQTIILEPSNLELNEVAITSSIRHLNIISDIDLKTNPVKSSQELLRKVPGLFIGQHAGGGKAEQIFLRGFDIDHGTDINISVDGMPVNMVSHAHGQGYADLHFLIPEIIENIDFDKGPYHADKGNLATAGYVAFKTRERLDNNNVTVEAGKFNTYRTLGMFNLVNDGKQSAYVAADYQMTDGYFVSPQHFNRINLTGKYTAYMDNNDKLSLSVSHFNSKWDASGQIPQRAIDAGLITRFGAIDNTEGGNTSRTNVNLQYLKHVDENTFVRSTAFYSRYNFELYSNFTFFLEDPVNGDQIRQKENRSIFGFESELNKSFYPGGNPLEFKAAVGLRNDNVDNIELSHTVNRKTTLEQLKLGDVNETNLYAYASAEYKLGNWLINPAVRVDHFEFDYVDKLATAYATQSQGKSIVSPKLNFLYNPSNKIQYFLKLGKGFHSNDTRVVVAQKGLETLPGAYGADLGLIWKPVSKLVVNTALWYLFLEQEFVYVGDAGIVEPSGKTTRKGIDLGARYQLGRWIFINGDLTYTHGRSNEAAKGEDRIPLAPVVTVAGGVSLHHPSGINAGINTRYLGHRPANEDNSIVAKGYCVTDANISYQYKQFTIGVITENIFNTAWNETQFATESRLKDEPAPVTEIHFTPGTPFNIRGTLSYKF
ncbi:TonB-dependent receptor plug domain-containing protein [Chitinophaga sp. S165]|uniref:TonB-dependent receptor n=1 Tax=Chitinophaga sp. S165 TaxID=2135462 RepID=UPI000D70E197|nr:TonB-dependent receptor plug domain-containing protein [Chitinophaga sp. S165]PWV48959.1 outer membrane receptor protein involved in Fe transport [Chitinophaga sp. S165]